MRYKAIFFYHHLVTRALNEALLVFTNPVPPEQPQRPQHVIQRRSTVGASHVRAQTVQRRRRTLANREAAPIEIPAPQQKSIGIQVEMPEPHRIEQQSIGIQVEMPQLQEHHDSNGMEEDWCICRGTGEGEMVFCENEQCMIKWFHTDCISMETVPEDDWYCPNCSMLQ